MKRILSKRILREFKSNLGRYLALSAVIALCMYLIISIVGAANMIIKGTKEHQIKNHLEDGEFETLVKLTADEMNQIKSHDITLEPQFSIDVKTSEDDTLRIFKIRENINLIELDSGAFAQNKNEIVIEKRYAQSNDLNLGSTIIIDGTNYTVTGIGTTPDYDAVLKDFSDTAIDSTSFGTAFVSNETYDILKQSDSLVNAETYRYAFIISGNYTAQDLKDLLINNKIDADTITDEAFKEYWDRTGGKIHELQDGIDELLSGCEELENGLDDLTSHNDDLTAAADSLLDSYLINASSSISSLFPNTELTKENYYDTLTALSKNIPEGQAQNSIIELRNTLESLVEFSDGINEYTSGTSKAYDGSSKILDGVNEMDEETDKYINETYDISISNLTMFLEKDDNNRISGASNDVILNYQVGLIAGVIVMILFTYVISVFVVHTINNDSSIIGTLYALGATKTDLISHYITLPVIICFIAGTIGTILGFSPIGIPIQTFDSYSYYSLPVFTIIYEPYLLFYGAIMPPLVASVVNNLIIRKKLSATALSLIKNEQNKGKKQNLKMNKLGFIQKFQIRQLINEMRSALAIVFGLFISLLIIMMSLDCYTLCSNVAKDMIEDTKYSYLYFYKFPQETLPPEGHIAYGTTLKSEEVFGYTFDTIVYGITEDNPYFDLTLPSASDEVVISEQLHSKMNLDVGDNLVLRDNEENKMYAFRIVGITKYSTQLSCFMSIDSAREIFGAGKDEYNIIFSNHKLDIPSNVLITNLSKDELTKGASVFVELMSGLIIVLAVASIIILILVMYLMMKVMIDRQTYSISLMKVFGYKGKDIKKLYINGNFYVIVIGSLISIPLTKLLMNAIFPYFVSNGAININLTTNPLFYAGIFLLIIILYFIISSVLLIRINKIIPAEALKNRE